MRVDETVESRHQPLALGAAVIGIGAHPDHLEAAAVMAFDQLHDMGRDRMMADIGGNIGQTNPVMPISVVASGGGR